MNCLFSENLMSQDCFETILNTMAEAVIICGTDNRILYANKKMEEIYGDSLDKIVLSDIYELIYPVISEDTEGIFYGEMNRKEGFVRSSSGKEIPVEINSRSIKNSIGSSIGTVFTMTDIFELKMSRARIGELEEFLDIGNGKSKYNIIGRSNAIKEVLELITLAAASKATVLVTGESGTGKELVARAIKDNGEFADKPYVVLNCSALSENLLESELFGHVKGSFTGAFKDKKGRFELADGGTLFLDEIGEISPLIQVKLLRFLQEREFERVGEGITRKADVRIIAATNKNLRKMVREGMFREDLYYRLKVFQIHLPPLRDRKEDIPSLVNFFIKKFSHITGKKINGLTRDAAVTLLDYCWPGNIRELENAIEHAFVTSPGGEITIFDLPLEISKGDLRTDICNNEINDSFGFSSSFKPTEGNVNFSTLTADELEKLLREHGGNKSDLAKFLGVDRTTLWRKMKKLGIK